MKLIKRWKLSREYKAACRPILRKRWFGTPRALKECCEPVSKTEGRLLAERLVKIATEINRIAPKGGGRFAICAGLAANQIGVNKNVFVMLQKDGSFKTFINPVILKKEGQKYLTDEHCFSTNFKPVKVIRWPKVTIKADGLTPKRLSGLQAQAFQHEYDHLEGKI